MAIHAVPFQKGLSRVAFMSRYGTEAKCYHVLYRTRWPDGLCCPACADRRRSSFRRDGQLYYQCRVYRHQRTLLSDTRFEATKLPWRTWFLAIHLLTSTKTHLAALESKGHLGVCYRTAWRVKHKIMQAMATREADRQLGGIVLIDDAYLGGERNGGKRGRGSENKVPFVIAVEVCDEGHPRQTVISPVSGFTLSGLAAWTRRHLRPGTDVHSDGLGAFGAVIDAGHAHTVVESAEGREATEASGMRWLNTVLSNVKRSLEGTYHAFGFSVYAHGYLSEAAWRFNRRFDLPTLARRLVTAVVRREACPERRLRAVTPLDAG